MFSVARKGVACSVARALVGVNTGVRVNTRAFSLLRPSPQFSRFGGLNTMRSSSLGLANARFASSSSAASAATDAASAATDAADAASKAGDAASKAADAASTAASKFDTSLGFDNSVGEAVANADGVTQATNLTSDQLGYMHSVGLADGWWPSDIFQQALELVHVFSGMPWWVTICLTTIAFRLLLFPAFMRSSNTMAKSQLIAPQTDKIRKEISKASQQGDQRTQQIKLFEMRQLNKKYGIRYRDMMLSPAIQMTFAMGAFFGVREMCLLPVQGFTTGGAEWFTDLTAADPYCGLQLISAVLYSSSFAMGGETATASYGPTMKKVFLVLPFLSVAFTWNLSAGTMVYLTANGVCSVIQSQLLRNNTFRKWAGMVPMDTKRLAKKAAETENKDGILGNMSKSWKDMQANAEVKAEVAEKGREATERLRERGKSQRVVVKRKKHSK